MTTSTKNSLWLINLGQIRGTPVFLHASFVLLFVWLLFVEAWAPQETMAATLLLLGYLVALVVHELSHLLAALYTRTFFSHITLLPSGAITVTSRKGNIGHRLLVAIAGPLGNIITGVTLLFIVGISSLNEFITPSSLIFACATANLLLGFINFLPIFPLDGWRIARLIIEVSGSKVGVQSLSRISQIISITLVLLSIATATPWLAVLGVLCGLSTMREGFRLKTTLIADSLVVREVMIQRGSLTLLPHSVTISSAMDAVVKSFQQYFPVVHNDEALGLVVRDNFLHAIASGQADDYISNIMVRDCPRIHTEDSLRPIIEQAFEDGQEVFIVLDAQERFAGLLVKNQVVELLLLGSIFNQSKRHEIPDEFWL